MNKKNNKFFSFSFAIREILDDFRSDPKQYDLFAKVYSFLVGGKAVPGEEKCPPMGIRNQAEYAARIDLVLIGSIVLVCMKRNERLRQANE